MKAPLPATSFIVSQGLLVAQSLLVLPALAAPADLDSTFGIGGKVTTPIGIRAFGDSIAVQGDGKIVVAGSTFNGSHFDIAVVRYNADGSLDTSFNGTGKAITDLSNGSGDSAHRAAVQSDGKIVVAGVSNFGLSSSKVAVVRYLANGSLDSSFNGTGVVLASAGLSAFNSASSVAVQTDGKIVVAGMERFGFNTRSRLLVRRFTAAGAVDTSFNGTGYVVTDVGAGRDGSVAELAIQNDGRIVVVGSSELETNDNFFSDIVLARYTATGALDTSFSGDGILTTDISSIDFGYSVAVQSDGKIVLTGRVTGPGRLALMRYTNTGDLDTSFNSTGIVLTDGTNTNVGSHMALQTDGRILVATSALSASSNDFALLRYTSAGALDTDFNGTGMVTTDFGSSDIAGSVVVQSDGRILVAGYTQITSEDYRFALARYEGDAVAPPEIGITGNGLTITDGDTATSAADGTDFGSIHVSTGLSARTFTIENNGTGVLRINPQTVSILGPQAADFIVAAFAPTSVAAGGSATFMIKFDPRDIGPRSATITIFSNDSDEAVYDFAVEGTGFVVTGDPDPTFNATGIATTDLNTFDTGASVAVQSDDKIVVAGSAANAGVSDFAVARYTRNGAPDTSFNGTGKVTTDLGSSEDEAQCVAVQSDGRIVVAGYIHNGSNFDFAVVRYTATGGLDATFNGTGIVITPIGTGHDQAYSVALQPDGKIVVAGYSIGNFAVVRYTSTGAPDTSFGGDGIVTTNISGFDLARSVAVQSDGKIVAAGESDPPGSLTPAGFSLARYHADGSLDTSFNGTGRVTTSIGDMDSRATGMTIQCDGKIIVVGFAMGEVSSGLALVRFTPAGALDTSFNGTGIVSGESAPPGILASSVTMQADGKIVVGGSGDLDFGLARFTASGALELSVTTNLATIGSGVSTQTSRDAGSSVALQSDGKIVLAGSIEIPAGYSDFALVRYASDTPRQMFDNATAAAGLTGAAASPDATPFHDGITNLLKYAFRINLAGPDVPPPSHGGNAGLPSAQLFHDAGEAWWQIEFVRLKGSGLIYTPLKSTILAPDSFVPMTGAVTVQSLGSECERVIVRELVGPAETRLFNRVQVTLLP